MTNLKPLKIITPQLFLGLLTLFLTVFNCVYAIAEDEKTTIKIAFTIPLEGDTFETTKSLYTVHREITSQLAWPLLLLTKNGQLLPASAERWEVEDDGKSVRFYLRDDLKWSDGTPVTAQDFYRNLQNLAGQDKLINKTLMGIKNWQKWMDGDLDAKIGVTVVNDHELFFQFENEASLNLNDFAETVVIAIAENDYLETQDKPWIESTKRLSYGPYRIKAASNDEIIIEKNPYFPEKNNVELDEITFIGGTFEAAIEQYSSDVIDILSGPIGRQKRWVVDTYSDEIIDVGAPRVYFLWPDLRKAIFSNTNILDALFISLDRSTFGNALFGSKINSLPSNIPNGMGGYPAIEHPDVSQPLDDRIARAKQIMKKSGYGANNLLNIKIGVAPVPGYNAISALVMGSWKTIFVNVELIKTDSFYTMLDDFRNGDYDMVVGSFIEQNGNPLQYLTLLNEYSKIAKLPADPHYLELLEGVVNQKTGENHFDALQKLDRYILDKKLILPIVANAPMAILKPKFNNVGEATRYVVPKINLQHLKLNSQD